MKFDIYNTATWNPQCSCSCANTINTKAIGSIGQKMQQVRDLKSILETPITRVRVEERAYAYLKKTNPAALVSYEVIVENGSQKAGEIIRKCNYIISLWSNRESRPNNWRSIASWLSEIKPYLGLSQIQLLNQSLLQGTLSISGNEGWRAYCNLFQTLENMGWSPPDSIEDDLEDEDEEDFWDHS